jgi:hypothetical protein
MGSVNEQDHLNPNDLAYYVPRRLREGSEFRFPQREPSSTPPAPASFDTLLENAPSPSLQTLFDPEVIHKPSDFVRERDRRTRLISVARRIGAASGIAAVVALFFVFMVPASRDHAEQPDSGASSLSRMVQPIKTTLNQAVRRDDDPRSALGEFQPVLASTPTSPPVMTHEQSEALLQKFLQWHQKLDSTQPISMVDVLNQTGGETTTPDHGVKIP